MALFFIVRHSSEQDNIGTEAFGGPIILTTHDKTAT